VSDANVSTGPIADLSYRGYDGPLETRALRWWTVAQATLRLAIRKVWFWIWAVLSSLSYLFGILGLFLQSNLQAQVGQGLPKASWPSHFVNALPSSIFFLLAVTMVVGAASIAGDNRANALLVYLSKPLTKHDYVIGKWMGIFLLLLAVAFLPALLLYLYCLLSFRAEGFFTSDKLLLAKVLLVSIIAAAIHTSLILGFSAWSKNPLMAGAVYAAFYFLGVIVAPITALIISKGQFDSAKAITVRSLAIPGVIEGLAYHIYREYPGRGPFGVRFPMGEHLPRPGLWPILGLAVALAVIPIVLAYVRVRAVEVVRG
jgi:ABC-2 type transport system permease protein